MQPFPAPPSSAQQHASDVTRRGPYPYPYQGAYADPNAQQSPYGNPYNTTTSAAMSSAPADSRSTTAATASVDAAKAERRRVNAQKMLELISKKEARDQAEANVAAMREQLMRGRGAAFPTPSSRTGMAMDEDVEEKSSDAKHAKQKKKKSAFTSTDYLDFDEKFGGRTFNFLSVALVVSALLLFYVLWFTDLVY